MNRRSFFHRTLAALAAVMLPFRLSKRRAKASEPSVRVIVYTRRTPADPWTTQPHLHLRRLEWRLKPLVMQSLRVECVGGSIRWEAELEWYSGNRPNDLVGQQVLIEVRDNTPDLVIQWRGTVTRAGSLRRFFLAESRVFSSLATEAASPLHSAF